MKIADAAISYKNRFGEDLIKTTAITREYALSTLARMREKCYYPTFTSEYIEELAISSAIRNIAKELLTTEEAEIAGWSEYPTKAEWRNLFQVATAFADLGIASPQFDFSASL